MKIRGKLRQKDFQVKGYLLPALGFELAVYQPEQGISDKILRSYLHKRF